MSEKAKSKIKNDASKLAEAKAIQKALASITSADTSISKSLVAGELFLLGHLRVTPK